MITDPVKRYLRALRFRLWLRGLADRDTLRELEGHLLEAIEAGVQQGLGQEEAGRRALARFGTVKAVIHAFERERTVRMQYLLLAVGTASGLLMTYVDSRPGWDDTGITAGVLFLSAGFLTLLGFRRPWLMALAVGVWLPAYYIYGSRDPRMLVVLLIPLAGAYVGWGLRWGLNKVLHWA